MSETARRYPEIDAIKAAGIVTIVLIHALRSPWEPGVSELERWLGHVTRFGVPGFLLASGFLYAGAPADSATTWRRLRRILVPYLIASLLAQLWRAYAGLPSEGGTLIADLLLASSFGPYYYVFVIALLVALTPAVAQLPRPLLYALTGALVASQWFVDAATVALLSLYWHLRSPLLWWGYFLLGWVARLHEPELRAWAAPRRGALLWILSGAIVGLTALASWEEALPRTLVRTAMWLDVYAVLAFVALAASAVTALPGWLRWLSDATYAIYLYHVFFVLAVQRWLPPQPGEVVWGAILLPWLAGLAGGVAVVALGRALLGARSRDWLGA
jgi:surface polysaccharide O-acyltransferase-like enzyme